MTVLLVVLLVLLWGAVIVPALLANRHHRSSAEHFRRSLQTLGARATGRSPSLGAPGKRARSIDAGRWIMGPPKPPARRPVRRPSQVTRPAPARSAASRPATARSGAGRTVAARRPGPATARGYRPTGTFGPSGSYGDPYRPDPNRFRREWESVDGWDPVIDRRRQVFVGLLIGAAATLVLGLIPGLGILLKLNVVIDLALAGYVVYLIRAKVRRAPRDLVTDYEPEHDEEEWLQAGEL